MDARTFEQVVVENKDRVHGYARLMLRDATDAQDVAQESLVRLWNHRDRVDPTGARAWLMRTAHHLCVDRMRRRRVRSEIADGEAAIERRFDPAPRPDQLARAGELGRGLYAALAALSEQDRAVVVLREMQGLEYEEIARLLEVPLGTLKARLHRARERLRGELIRTGVAP